MAAGREALAGLLAALFADGLPQDRAGLTAIAGALGVDGVRQALARLAAEPDSSEHAPLVALLFSPGPELMQRLEPALAEADLNAADAAELAREVAQGFPRDVPLLLPDGGSALPFPATPEDITGFVRRLKPEATAPAELRGIVARRFPADVAAELGALLRHSRLAWSPAQIFFLAALLERVDADDGDLPGLTAWAAGFLDLCGPEFSPREALARRRQALETQLRQAEAAEKALQAGSYEQRLSQGLRLGHVHGPDAQAELARLDRACLLVLGVPGASLAGPGGMVVRDLGSAEDMDELLGLLP